MAERKLNRGDYVGAVIVGVGVGITVFAFDHLHPLTFLYCVLATCVLLVSFGAAIRHHRRPVSVSPTEEQSNG